jgi:hypothetical protein
MEGNQFTYGDQGTVRGRRWSIESGNGERLVSGKVDFDLDRKTELCRLSLQ